MATKVVKIDYAIKRINQLKKEFGPDSGVVKFAEDTLSRSIGKNKITADFYHKSGKHAGELNVNKLIKAYEQQGDKIQMLEKRLESTPKDDAHKVERAWIKDQLKQARQKERDFKQQVFIKKTNDVSRAFRTPNQIIKAEIESIKDKAKNGEALDETERGIAEAKTQKEVRENEDMKRLVTQRANYIAQVANEFNELDQKLYDLSNDNLAIPDEDERKNIRDLWESRTMTNDWLMRANEVVAKYYGSVIEKDISKLI